MERINLHLSVLLAIFLVASCSEAEPALSSTTSSFDDVPSLGTATVTKGDDTQTFTQWDAAFSIQQEEGGLATLELGFGANAGDRPKADSISVSIVRQKQAQGGPLSLVGTYELKYSRAPSYSGVVAVRWNGEEIFDSAFSESSANAESAGTLTISSHEAGRIQGSISSRMGDGSDVSATFEGEIRASCYVLPDDSQREETDYVHATFENEFCAQYFQ